MINPKRAIFISIPEGIDLVKLATAMEQLQFTDCKPAQEECWGFTRAEQWNEAQEMLWQCDGYALITLRHDRKVPPKTKLARLCQAALNKRKQELKRVLTKPERDAVREDIKKDMLPNETPREHIHQAVLWPSNNLMVLLTSVATDADFLVEKINRALEPQSIFIPWKAEQLQPELEEVLSNWLCDVEIAGKQGFDVGTSMSMENDGKARLSQQNPDTAEVREHLMAGKLVQSMELVIPEFDDGVPVSFVLTAKRTLSQIDLKKLIKARREQEEANPDEAEAEKQLLFVLGMKALMDLWKRVSAIEVT